MFRGPQETQLVKDNGLPDNEQITSSHIGLPLSTVIELVPISVIHRYIFYPGCALKLHSSNSICSTLELSVYQHRDVPSFISLSL